jgi:hypothetical protein
MTSQTSSNETHNYEQKQEMGKNRSNKRTENCWAFPIPAAVAERYRFYSCAGTSCIRLIIFFCLAVPILSAQTQNETLLPLENAYNPIPSPDGKMIAYVHTGWGRPGGSGGFGRSNLISEVLVATNDGKPVTETPLTDTFLAGWTPDGTALVTYRDWRYSLTTLSGKKSLQGELRRPENVRPTERIFYLSSLGQIAWSRVGAASNTVIETRDHIIAEHTGWLGDIVVPSPDERYLAVFGEAWRTNLWVYDMQLLRWSDLGPVTVYPAADWDYIKATWNPWFADSSHLAYVSGSTLVISEPDGNRKRTIPIDGQAGLATPSPDGKCVAYLTFAPRPRNTRPDLQFWGDSIIWVMPLAPEGKPTAVTKRNPATTYDLRWIGNHSLVFDRFDDEDFPTHPRMLRVSVGTGHGKDAP